MTFRDLSKNPKIEEQQKKLIDVHDFLVNEVAFESSLNEMILGLEKFAVQIKSVDLIK